MIRFALTDQQQFLVSLIATGALDTNEVAKKLGINRTAAQNRLQTLRKRGSIECVRSSKTYIWCTPEARYSLAEKLGERQRLAAVDARKDYLRKKAIDNRERKLRKLAEEKHGAIEDRPFLQSIVPASQCKPFLGLVRSVFELAA